MKSYKRCIPILLITALLLSLLTACSEKLTLQVKFTLSEEDRVYYIGDEFDGLIETENGVVSRIPEIYTVDGKGNLSEDISHSENVTYSGYDMNKTGKQTVTVTYLDGNKKLKTTYGIEVQEQSVLFIEASDPMHLSFGAFKVGDTFNTYGTDANGDEVGVTVVLHMKDPSNPELKYFTNHEEMKSLIVDTSDCTLDNSGKFTKPGIFNVHLTYKGFKTTYQIKVEE